MKWVLFWTAGIVGLLGLIFGVLVLVAIPSSIDVNIYGTDTGRSDQSPAWTPDGKHIVFTTSTGDLYEIDADGQNERRLTDGAAADAPAVSPDGTRIAFTDVSSDPYLVPDLFLAAADGSGSTAIAHTAREEDDPAWSPDGKQLAFSRRAETGDEFDPEWLLVVRADGSDRPRRLVRTDLAGQHPSWSPDGRFIAYSGAKGIYVIPSAGGKPRLIVRGYLNLPAWAPHTNRLAAVDGDTIKILQLRGRRRARISRAFKLSGLLNGVEHIAWEPHERKIAFSGENGLSGGSCLFVLDMKHGSVTELTNPEGKCNVQAKRERVGT